MTGPRDGGEEAGVDAGAAGARREVVVGVDGSADALRAVRWAAREAQRWDSSLRLVAAHGLRDAGAITRRTGEHSLREALRRDAAEALAGAAATAAEVAPDVATRTRTVAGPPVDVLRAESRSARLLVLGDRGRGRRHDDPGPVPGRRRAR